MPRLAKKQSFTSEKGINGIKVSRKLFPLLVPTIPTEKCTVLVCGTGDVGQLGLGPNRMEIGRPAKVNIPDAVSVCAGGMHTLVLTSDGRVYSFGCNDEGALGRDTSEEDSEYAPGVVELPSKAVMISAGDSHSACLLDNGTVMAWGSFRDSHGNMGLTLEGNKRVPIALLSVIQCCSIASGADHLVILATLGHVFTIGCAEQCQLGRVTQRSASGEGRRGKTEILSVAKIISPRSKLIDKIWATNYGTFMREAVSHRIFDFGLNNYKQLLLTSNKEVITYPVVLKVNDVKTIAGGQHHTMVLKTDDTVHVVGRGDYGRLGLGKVNADVETLKPLNALNGIKIKDISCGESTSFAITNKGEIYVWGFGSNKQLGNGNEDDVEVLQHVEFKAAESKPIVQAVSGGQHSVFLVKQE